MEAKQKKLEKSQIEITFELTVEEFAEHFEHALEHLKSHVKVDGFREGKAPAKIVEEKLKPEALLMEAGDHAVKHVYSDYVLENKLEPVGQPEVQIKKIAKGSPFIFTAKNRIGWKDKNEITGKDGAALIPDLNGIVKDIYGSNK